MDEIEYLVTQGDPTQFFWEEVSWFHSKLILLISEGNQPRLFLERFKYVIYKFSIWKNLVYGR